MPAFQENLNQADHLGDVPGGARLVGRWQAAERRVGVVEFPLIAVGVRPPLDAGRRRLRQDLVVDIGDIRHDGDLVALEGQPAPQHVEDHLFADVPEMRRGLDGEPTVIDRHLPGNQRDKVLDSSGGGVVQAQTHPVQSSAVRCTRAADCCQAA